ncbi:MAG: pilus assembly protein PilP [Gammaproteobacteria bacterium]|nr:pilus assembly protein PilP [Gammaproteobacteria bacterium]
MKTQTIKLFLLSILATLVLFACDNSKNLQDLKSYVKKLKSATATEKKAPVQSPILLLKPTHFNVESGRSPFENSAPKIKNSNILPLQAYSLNQLKFKGTITDNNIASAYILTPDNKIYQAQVGDLIGDHSGKIKKILPDHIEIEENVTNGNSGTIQQILTLQLKEGS